MLSFHLVVLYLLGALTRSGRILFVHLGLTAFLLLILRHPLLLLISPIHSHRPVPHALICPAPIINLHHSTLASHCILFASSLWSFPSSLDGFFSFRCISVKDRLVVTERRHNLPHVFLLFAMYVLSSPSSQSPRSMGCLDCDAGRL